MALAPSRRPWTAAAACTGMTELFFPAWGGEDRRQLPAHVVAQVAEATAICAGCPVRPECLDDAVKRGEQHGVWGGRLFTSSTAGRLRKARKREAGAAA